MRSYLFVYVFALLFAAMAIAAPTDATPVKRKALKQYDMRRATPVKRDAEHWKPKPSK